MEIINTVYLSIGSNLGDRISNLQTAVIEIASQIGKIKEISSIYESEPIGFNSTELFLNACIQVESYKNAFQILELIQEIEIKAGRVKSQNQEYISRVLDIDIVFYNQETIETQNLKVPHPFFQERLFVLLPMHDLNPDFKDPNTLLRIEQLIKKCTDNSKLAKIKLLLNF
jgi:2-amino-4-hydroxy-6-hydroxymethyldihydropteridine diphosphokinase